jgi:hypothetical protein
MSLPDLAKLLIIEKWLFTNERTKNLGNTRSSLEVAMRLSQLGYIEEMITALQAVYTATTDQGNQLADLIQAINNLKVKPVMAKTNRYSVATSTESSVLVERRQERAELSIYNESVYPLHIGYGDEPVQIEGERANYSEIVHPNSYRNISGSRVQLAINGAWKGGREGYARITEYFA